MLEKGPRRKSRDAIETAAANDMIVELEVWFNDGSESVTLHRLNGELEVTVGVFEEL